MELGFDTIGNATLICYDRTPILVTDPWVRGSAYFGSWSLSHVIPAEQQHAIHACPYVWFSHGHPDHLNPDSLPLFKDKTILLPDHIGHRIRDVLSHNGYRVQVLPDMEWTTLSDQIHICCITDYNQDAILLIDLNGCLIVNVNDAWEHRGWGPAVQQLIAHYSVSFLLALSGFGDANMNNFYTEDGAFIPPPAALKTPVGPQIAQRLAYFGARFFIPFSSMHRYQRRDSLWANQYVTTLADYPIGFDATTSTLLPAFIRYDRLRDTVDELHPSEAPDVVLAPEDFGDHWHDPLTRHDVDALTAYVHAIAYLPESLDFCNFRVGGQDHIIALKSRPFTRGVTFEAPRQSLMTAVQQEIFDDLLIGNFVKTTLHGVWEIPFGRAFTPFIAKYADNGQAKSLGELQSYVEAYAARATSRGWPAPADPYLAPLHQTLAALLPPPS